MRIRKRNKRNPKKEAARLRHHGRCVLLSLRETEIGVNPKYRNGKAKHAISEGDWIALCKQWDKDNGLTPQVRV